MSTDHPCVRKERRKAGSGDILRSEILNDAAGARYRVWPSIDDHLERKALETKGPFWDTSS